MVLAGRGFGKTRMGAEDAAAFGIDNPGTRIAVVAPTFADARNVCIEGESGLLSCIPPELTENGNNWNRSLGELTLTNGTKYSLYSADQPDRLRGPQHARSWCDELAVWGKSGGSPQDTWDMLQMGLRLGKHPQNIITTTPKPIKLIRDLVADPHTHVVSGTTFDNEANLPESFIHSILNKYKGTRLGEQELYAKILDEVPGALWQRSWIEDTRISGETPDEVARRCIRIVVAIDPAVTSGEDSDLTGIVACGSDEKGRGYVLADETCRVSPRDWAVKAIRLLRRFNGDCLIGETNNGGDLVESTIRMIDENVPFKKVTASRGKYLRAEPIAALFEQKRIGHVGTFSDLEDQMCRFTVDNIAKESPDRVDSMVYALHDLFDSPMNFGVLEVMKQEAATSPLERMQEMSKVGRSTLQKPVTSKETPACIGCGKTTVARIGSMFSCSSCGARWMGGNTLGTTPHPRYNFLSK